MSIMVSTSRSAVTFLICRRDHYQTLALCGRFHQMVWVMGFFNAFLHTCSRRADFSLCLTAPSAHSPRMRMQHQEKYVRCCRQGASHRTIIFASITEATADLRDAHPNLLPSIAGPGRDWLHQRQLQRLSMPRPRPCRIRTPSQRANNGVVHPLPRFTSSLFSSTLIFD